MESGLKGSLFSLVFAAPSSFCVVVVCAASKGGVVIPKGEAPLPPNNPPFASEKKPLMGRKSSRAQNQWEIEYCVIFFEFAKEQRDERNYHILQERLRLEGKQSFSFAALICFSRESRSRSARISTSSICLSSFALLSQTSSLSFCCSTKHENLQD